MQNSSDASREAVANVGARERRKRAVAASIERIAVDLALDLGLDHVTVEMICERALISHRTFYNYFPTKEAAVFGPGPQPTAELIAAFRNGTSRDVVGDLLDLLAATAFADVGQEELFRDRRRLLKQEPQLAVKATPKFERFLAELTDLTLARLTGMDPSAEPTADLRERASMIVALATAVMQRSLQTQLEAADDSDPRAVLDHSIRLARSILSEGPEQ